MARIEPFKGLRPRKDIAHLVASPPYDVLNSREARQLASGNEFSFLHIIKPEIDLPENTDIYSDPVYQKAKSNLDYFIKEKILIQDSQKSFYIYKQVWGNHIQVGLVAGASVQDYQENKIKKHEFTRAVKEKDRMRHIESLNANTGPVFLTFKYNQEILKLFEKAMEGHPEYDFKSKDGVHHLFYLVSDTRLIQNLQREFSNLDALYVADGHHRSAAAAVVKQKRETQNSGHHGDEEYNFFLSVIFPHNQMKILAYNRVVKSLGNQCKAEFFHRLSENFSYEESEIKVPQEPREFCLYIEGKWYRLNARENSFNVHDPVDSLDVSILQKNLLDPVLGITDPRTDDRIDFIGGIRGTTELEKRV
ncbi:MAG: DUF1015 domain-containing protein, partial [Candidatus Aminicenantes bacterium]|nr:DUF1015 domain-containing protein [Candidatus Aminicenantes bacterium]